MNSSITELISLHIIILRIFLSTIIGGIIGYERGSNNQAVGLGTHIFSLSWSNSNFSYSRTNSKINLLNYAIENPFKLSGFKTDLGCLGLK